MSADSNREYLKDPLGGEPDDEGGPQYEQQNGDEIHHCSPPQHTRAFDRLRRKRFCWQSVGNRRFSEHDRGEC